MNIEQIREKAKKRIEIGETILANLTDEPQLVDELRDPDQDYQLACDVALAMHGNGLISCIKYYGHRFYFRKDRRAAAMFVNCNHWAEIKNYF